MKRHIKPEGVEINNFGNIIVQNLFNNESFNKLSIAKIKIHGDQKFGLDKTSDIFYYILEGEGKFFIEDKIIRVKVGDLIHIPKNTKYKDSGNLTLLAISSPRFDPKSHMFFEE